MTTGIWVLYWNKFKVDYPTNWIHISWINFNLILKSF